MAQEYPGTGTLRGVAQNDNMLITCSRDPKAAVAAELGDCGIQHPVLD